MMNFKLPSQNPHGINRNLIIGVAGAVGEDSYCVEIINRSTGQKLGTKIFFGLSDFEVGLLGYAVQNIRIRPADASSVVSFDHGRALNIVLKIGEQTSAPLMVCGSTQNLPLGTVLSAVEGVAPITLTQSAEIALLTSSAHKVSARVYLRSELEGVAEQEITLANQVSGDGVLVLSVSGAHFTQQITAIGGQIEHYTKVEVVVEFDGVEVLRHKFEIRPDCSDGVRLCWVNKRGGVDYCTFPFIRRRVANIDKTKVRSSECGRISSAVVERQIVVCSEFMDAPMFEQVAQVVASPEVWLVGEDGVLESVEVVEKQVSIQPNQQQRLEITVSREVEESYIV